MRLNGMFLALAVFTFTLTASASDLKCEGLMNAKATHLSTQFAANAILDVMSLKHPEVQKWLQTARTPDEQYFIVQFCTGGGELKKSTRGWTFATQSTREKRVDELLENLIKWSRIFATQRIFTWPGIKPQADFIARGRHVSSFFKSLNNNSEVRDTVRTSLISSLPEVTRTARQYENVFDRYLKLSEQGSQDVRTLWENLSSKQKIYLTIGTIVLSGAAGVRIGEPPLFGVLTGTPFLALSFYGVSKTLQGAQLLLRQVARWESQMLKSKLMSYSNEASPVPSPDMPLAEKIQRDWDSAARSDFGVYALKYSIENKDFSADDEGFSYEVNAINQILLIIESNLSPQNFVRSSLLLMKYELIPDLGIITDFGQTLELVRVLFEHSHKFHLSEAQQQALKKAAKIRLEFADELRDDKAFDEIERPNFQPDFYWTEAEWGARD